MLLSISECTNPIHPPIYSHSTVFIDVHLGSPDLRHILFDVSSVMPHSALCSDAPM